MKYVQLKVGNSSALICISKGSNLCRLSFKGNTVIDYDEPVLMNGGYTGTPVLYPTPNRVRNAAFIYNSEMYVFEKNGKLIDCHGLVHDEEWQYLPPQKTSDGVTLKTWIEFAEGSSVYKSFPFQHTLELHYTLMKNRIMIKYQIINQDTKPIPYGIGFHPYFRKTGGNFDTKVKINCRCYMERDQDFFPTKRIIAVKNTRYDLREYTSVSEEYDDVFCDMTKSTESALIAYDTENRISLKASDDFRYIVLYTPSGENYLCIEQQTCSADAHNLYNEGFDSGIIVLQPGENKSGHVEYCMKRIRS